MQGYRTTALSTVSAVTIAAFLSVASPALAQERAAPATSPKTLPSAGTDSSQPDSPQSTSGPATAADAPDIIVTGSRITRSGFKSPTPTTVLGADQLALIAKPNIADAINQLPALGIGFTPTTGNQGSSLGVGGLNILNLRNLGPTRTVVLLNGHRINPSTDSGLVNINLIPAQLVERIDVVTGGASAAYGSDAIAGVVNFILKKKFEGLAVDIQSGISGQGDGGERKISATFGTGFAGGRGNFILSGEYSDQDPIPRLNSRKWFNATKLVGNPAGGSPARILVPNVNISNAAPGGLILNVPANGTLAGTQFGEGGAPSRFVFGTASGTAGLMIGGQSNDLAGVIPILAALKDRNVFSRLSFDVTPSVALYLEGNYSYSHALNPNIYQFKLGNLTIKQDNAFLPASVSSQMAAQGLAQVTFGTWNQDLGLLGVENVLNSYRGMVGTDIKLGGTWKASAFYQYGRTDSLQKVNGASITSRYNQAIDAVRNASGTIVCRNPAGGCVPLNIIGTGVASRDAIAWVTGSSQRQSRIEEQVASLAISGEPFNIWAGPVSVSFGGEYRRESAKESVDALSLASAFFSGNFKPTNGAFNVKEAFFETVIPLAKDLPFARSIELNGAVRATEYSTSGYVTTWKIGGTWRPTNDLLFRAVRSRDIRAPNIADLFAQSTTTNTVTDPFNGGRSDTILAYVNSGNPALKPEISQSITAGVVFSPSWLPGLQASFDWYHVKVGGFITGIAPNVQGAINLCFQGNSLACSLITRDPAGHISVIRLQGVNAGRLDSKGFDVEVSYRTDLSRIAAGLGTLNIRALYSRLDKLNVDTSVVAHEYAGEVSYTASPFGTSAAFFPSSRGSLSLTYQKGGLTIGLTGRYIGPGVVDNTYTAADIASNRVSSVFYADGQLSYRLVNVPSHPEIYFAIDNMFDKSPPVVAPLGSNAFLNTGTSPGLYDTVGRYMRVGFRAKF